MDNHSIHSCTTAICTCLKKMVRVAKSKAMTVHRYVSYGVDVLVYVSKVPTGNTDNRLKLSFSNCNM